MLKSVWILGDQLTLRNSALQGACAERDVVLMIESLPRARSLPFHQQKLVFIWSAMRHFASELTQHGYTVDYYQAAEDLGAALSTHLRRYQPDSVQLMDSADFGRASQLARRLRALGAQVKVTPNTLFLSDRAAFARDHAPGRPAKLETFYRGMRRKTPLLIQQGEPAGGRWNFDRDNRMSPPRDLVLPTIPHYAPDAMTRELIAFVRRKFPGNFGNLDGFAWPVTRDQALNSLEDFLEHRLDGFGPYEDAMLAGQRALFHSLLSPLLNVGLLDPMEIALKAQACLDEGRARLSSVEGFIRQLIGWREFVYQIYHLNMPSYLDSNYLGADLALPDFYWTGATQLACLRDALQTLIATGSNHHIQRLMVLGNFALLAGVRPRALEAWYHLAYIDAYEWVVSPNVLGLTLFADGGLLASKPYAASGAYIHRMSNYCRNCAYDYRQVLGENACPFNALYWDFLARHRPTLSQNPRMLLAMSNLSKRSELAAIRARAAQIRDRLCAGEEP